MSFDTLLDHVVWKNGVLVDPANIATIVNLEALTNVTMLRSTLGHTGDYRRFIRGYAEITEPMERLLRKTEDPRKWEH